MCAACRTLQMKLKKCMQKKAFACNCFEFVISHLWLLIRSHAVLLFWVGDILDTKISTTAIFNWKRSNYYLKWNQEMKIFPHFELTGKNFSENKGTGFCFFLWSSSFARTPIWWSLFSQISWHVPTFQCWEAKFSEPGTDIDTMFSLNNCARS